MSGINFGVDWDVVQDVNAALKTEQARLEKNPLQKEGKKLTPAQVRDATFAEIAQAITESNFQLAQEILANNPKLDFTVGAVAQVEDSLIENFNRPLAQMLNTRGLSLNGYALSEHLKERHDPEMLTHLIEQNKTNGTMEQLDYLYQSTLKGFTANLSELRRQELRAQRSMLEHADLQIFARAVNSDEFVTVFTNYTTLPDPERNQIASISHDNWSVLFYKWFDSFTGHYFSKGATLGLKTIKNVLNFLNDFPAAQNGWNTAVENLRTANQAHKDFIVQYFKPDERFKDTQLYQILNQFQATTHGFRYSVYEPYSEDTLSKKMGITPFGLQELGASEWMTYDLQEVNGVTPPFMKTSIYKFPSFAHVLVQSASQASLALLESEAGQRAYALCLQEPAVLRNWCLRASPEMINTVVRSCPQLLEWRDSHNNCLAHYLVALRKESSKTFGQLMARLNHNWLLHENDQGVSVKDLFKNFGASENMLITLDKEAIKRSIKDAGVKKTRTAPAPKRRM